MIETVTAVRFERVMGSGRTRPCLMMCERKTGEEIEAVVKLRGNREFSPGAFLAEAFSVLLARDLGFTVSTPFCVTIEEDLAQTVPESELHAVFMNSIGNNFGSQKWPPGYTIWPKDKTTGKELKVPMMELLAFDGLIQNPDRRTDNPNCAFLGDKLLLYDHDAAFSNFMDILPAKPWDPNGLKFLKNHIFLQALKGEALILDRFERAFSEIEEARLRAYISSIPDDWGGSMITGERIVQYLLDCRKHFGGIKLQLEGIL